MEKNSRIISHWHHLMLGFQESPQHFYSTLEAAVKFREVPGIKLTRKNYKEGGILSAKREYFRVLRAEYIFDICAAPFANSFFVSWWLTEGAGCLASLPIVGPLMMLAKPVTYFKHDTTIIFQELVHSAVLEVIDEITKAKGIRELSESERRPVMREFLK